MCGLLLVSSKVYAAKEVCLHPTTHPTQACHLVNLGINVTMLLPPAHELYIKRYRSEHDQAKYIFTVQARNKT